MNNKLILAAVAVIAIIVVAAGGFYFMNANKSQTPAPQESVSQPIASPTSEISPEATGENEIIVEGEEFKFSPSEITVKKGEKVKLTFKNAGNTAHDFVIAGLGLSTKRINPGEEDTIEFTADKTGRFKFNCSVGNHEEQGMTGTLIVE